MPACRFLAAAPDTLNKARLSVSRLAVLLPMASFDWCLYSAAKMGEGLAHWFFRRMYVDR